MTVKFSGQIESTDNILRVNASNDPDQAVPSGLVGVAFNRGASGGVLRDAAGIFWNESLGAFVAQKVEDDDTPVAGYLPVKFGAAEFTDTVTAPLFDGDLRPASTTERGGAQVDGTSIVATAGGVISTVLGAQGGQEADEGLMMNLFARVRKTIKSVVASIAALTERVVALEAIPHDEQIQYATVTFDPTSVANGAAIQSTAITSFTNAAFGDLVEVAPPYDLLGCVAVGYVTQAGQIKITISNTSGAARDFASGTWKIRLTKLSISN